MSELEKNIPKELLLKYKESKEKFEHTSILYNANTDKYLITIIPFGWCKKNLFLTKIK